MSRTAEEIRRLIEETGQASTEYAVELSPILRSQRQCSHPLHLNHLGREREQGVSKSPLHVPSFGEDMTLLRRLW